MEPSLWVSSGGSRPRALASADDMKKVPPFVGSAAGRDIAAVKASGVRASAQSAARMSL
jgi:hypothetical protein